MYVTYSIIEEKYVNNLLYMYIDDKAVRLYSIIISKNRKKQNQTHNSNRNKEY